MQSTELDIDSEFQLGVLNQKNNWLQTSFNAFLHKKESLEDCKGASYFL